MCLIMDDLEMGTKSDSAPKVHNTYIDRVTCADQPAMRKRIQVVHVTDRLSFRLEREGRSSKPNRGRKSQG